MAEVFYGDSPHGQVLSGLHEFLAAETGLSVPVPRKLNMIEQWEGAADIFGDALVLKDVILKGKEDDFRILTGFLVLDKGETKLQVDAARAIEETPDQYDPFIDYFMEQFVSRLINHRHEICVDLANERRRVESEKGTKLNTLRAARTGQVLLV